ncbi:hypothetical protein, partial [Comamonas kerstersii]|uniref:hypothetical protein n=1 Tax=Comamonas kerstersii TaxID=225992 RepID=UPI0026DA6E61
RKCAKESFLASRNLIRINLISVSLMHIHGLQIALRNGGEQEDAHIAAEQADRPTPAIKKQTIDLNNKFHCID